MPDQIFGRDKHQPILRGMEMKRSKAIMSGVAWVCLFVLCSNAHAFQNDPEVMGTWKSVDFVKSKADFIPGKKSWPGDLYLKEFTFNKKGETQNEAFTWTKGSVHFTEWNLDGTYEVRKINGVEYLFLEWISGDVAKRGAKASYYVFTKE